MKKKNSNLPIEDQIKKLEKAIVKHGDPDGMTAKKIKELKKL
jgi:hypothetical protein